MARKKPIISPLGQWAYPGEVTIIPSSKITMKGVNYPVLGIDDLGNQQMMMPGGEYDFPGQYVTEYPQMQFGGMSKRKVDKILNKNKDLNFVQRMYQPNTPSIMIPGQQYPATHFMESGDGRAYPTVVQMPDGTLQYLGDNAYDYANQTGQYIEFPNDRQARRFAKSYKKGTGVLEKFGKGGWLNKYQTGGAETSTEQNPERMQGININVKRKKVSDNPKYQYDNEGNLLYKPDINIHPYLLDNSTRDNFWVNPKLPIKNLNPTVEELRQVAASYYPIDNKLVNNPKLTFNYAEAKPSNYQASLEQEYVLPEVVGKSFGNFPLVKDDGYSPNRRWLTSLSDGDKDYKNNSAINAYGPGKYAYVLKTDPNNLVNYATKDKIENDLSLNNKVFYDYLAKNNYSPDTVDGLTRKLPDQIWNRAEQMRVEMRNNPEIMSWANLHNLDLGYKERYEDSEDNDDFAPKIPESIYAARLAQAGLPTNRPDYDYDEHETYIAQDPSKFSLVDYFPVDSFLKDANNNPKNKKDRWGEADDQALKNQMAKRMGIDPSAFNNGEYLIHYNKSPITEYTPGKKYGGWLEEYQVGGRAPIYTSDINDPRLASYNDSLYLYKSAKNDFNKFNKLSNNFDRDLNDEEWQRNSDRYDKLLNLQKNKWHTAEYFNDTYRPNYTANYPYKGPKSGLTIQPVGLEGFYREGYHFPRFKKPVQPYIYKKPEVSPIYTSDLNDPRLRSYRDSLNLYNSGEDYYRRLKKSSFDSPNIGVSEEDLKKARDENYKKYPWDKLKMPVSNEKSGKKFQPVSKYNIYVADVGHIESNRYKKPVQPYIYKKPEVVPEVKETPVVEPPKPSLFVSNIDRDMYTPGGGMAREYNIGVTLQDGNRKSFRTEKEFQDWKAANNLDISKAKVTEGRGYSYDYPENKKYGGWLDQFQTGGWAGWTPNVGKPYMRTSPAGSAGYSDNTRVSGPDLNNRKAAEAAQYARRSEKNGDTFIKYAKSQINPYNWGVTDYTKSGTRAQAFNAARKAGEKEFMWNDERYNTRKDTDPLKYTGDNPNQEEYDKILRTQYPEFYKILNRGQNVGNISFEGVTDYNSDRAFTMKYPNFVSTGNSKIGVGKNPLSSQEFISNLIAETAHVKDKNLDINIFNPYLWKFGSDFLKLGDTIYDTPGTAEYNAHRLIEPGIAMLAYGNLSPNDIKRIQKNLGVKEDGYFGETTYKALQNKYKDNEYIQEAIENNQILHQNLDNNPTFSRDTEIAKRYLRELNKEVPLKYYDKFKDFRKVTPPIDLEDIEYVPEIDTHTLKVSDYTDNALLSTSGDNMNALLLQQALRRRGYNLPKSTTKYGDLDGKYGEETKNALLDWQNKNSTKKQNGGWLNSYQPGGYVKYVPPSKRPLTLQSSNPSTTDNTRLVTQNTNVTPANRKAAEAGEYARKVGTITQGRNKSAYEKAKEASSLVAQAQQRKGSADPLDYVLDMVNPATYAFAATDLVGNTGSAISNTAQGNFKEAGSDLLNAGLNALYLLPAKGIAKAIASPMAFRPVEGMMYRGLGKEGFRDAVQSGVFRPKQLNYAPGRSVAEIGNTPKQFSNTYYAPSKKFGVIENYGPDYVAEVPYNEADFFRRYSKRNAWSYSTPKQIPITEGKILKKDWLLGYKPVDIPNVGQMSITPPVGGHVKSIAKELLGLTRNKGNKAAIAEGNTWLKNWIDDPVTQAKIDSDLGWIPQRGNVLKDKFDLGYEQAKSFRPNAKEYPISNQIQDLGESLFLKNPNEHMHAGNKGISNLYNKSPLERNLIKNNNTIDPKYGSFVSRNPGISQNQRALTTTHEGTHDWASDFLLTESGQKQDILNLLSPDTKVLSNQFNKLRNQGVSSKEILKTMGKENAYKGYFGTPTETHAKIMEIRKAFNMTPEQSKNLTPGQAKNIMNILDKGENVTNINPKFLDIIDRDPKKLATLFNRLWAVPAVAAASQLQEQKKGGQTSWLNKYK